MELDILKDKKVAELREIAAALGIANAKSLKKKEIVELLTRMHEEAEKEKAAQAEKAAAEEAKAPVEPAKTEEPAKPEEPDPKKGAPLKEGRMEKTGILELAEGGFGFLRFDNFLTSDEDIYVSP
ncbi:MAG: Rho termination factor N-terminal domain-containing protein, partial [Oscillospiraceae bacterium]|nr:Rho termination factor N-terminal domain-containing protein [Oscillospiraceae bacterium]